MEEVIEGEKIREHEIKEERDNYKKRKKIWFCLG